jgi:N-hydroxyarylamine O-acetyltransferase
VNDHPGYSSPVTGESPAFDLPAYLERIGVPEGAVVRADRAALDAIIWGHLRRIPFENLDIVIESEPRDPRPIKIDDASVFAKLVTRRRGGYCFEHNALLACALRAIGFTTTALAARVRLGPVPSPRTHMLLEVVVGGEPYLVDVGFGGQCPTRAVPVMPGEYPTAHATLSITIEPHGFFLLSQAAPDGAWQPLYAFTREPHQPIDFEVANHYTSTHPGSFFTTAPVAALTTETGRLTYARGELTHRAGPTTETTPITAAEQLLGVLAERFGLVFPAGTRFRGGPA